MPQSRGKERNQGLEIAEVVAIGLLVYISSILQNRGRKLNDLLVEFEITSTIFFFEKETFRKKLEA